MRQATLRNASTPGILGLLVLLVLACPAAGFAQSSGSALNSDNHARTTDPFDHHGRSGGRLGDPRPPVDGNGPAKPVPEPGTMALVGMGVVALGAAIRKRKSI